MEHGRRRHTEMSWHRLPAVDYGIGDQIRYWTRMQDLLGYAADWNIDLYITTAEDRQQLNRGRVGFILTHGVDVIPSINIIYTTPESEADHELQQ
jgi:hypothetical protein